jgi:hypothetical protein
MARQRVTILRKDRIKAKDFQTPPDLVVKPQLIDIIDFILRLVLRPRVVYQREITGRAALNM